MSHVAGEQLAAYWLGELEQDAAHALEEHVFACAACTETWTRTERVIAELRGLLPPVISPARLSELQARVPALPEVTVAPGGQATVRFDGDNDMFLVRLQADLARAQRVDFSVEVPGGATVVALPSVPFDPKMGALLVVCQRHFLSGAAPRHVQMRLRAIELGGQVVELGVYTVDHELSL